MILNETQYSKQKPGGTLREQLSNETPTDLLIASALHGNEGSSSWTVREEDRSTGKGGGLLKIGLLSVHFFTQQPLPNTFLWGARDTRSTLPCQVEEKADGADAGWSGLWWGCPG